MSEQSGNNWSYVSSVIASYWVVSISMVYLNKMLLSNPEASISAPLFVTWYQCVLTCLICIILGHVGEETRRNNSKSFFDQFPVVKFRTQGCIGILPLSLIFVVILYGASTAEVYSSCTAEYIPRTNSFLPFEMYSIDNVARCLSLVFNVIFTYMFLGKTTSLKTCSTLSVVIVGFILGINGEINFSLLGTAAGVLSSVFVSLNSIYTSKMLPVVDNDKSMLLYYNNFNASLLFLPLIVMFEWDILMQNVDKLVSSHFWFYMSITGVMGFAIGLVTVMQVKATSPLTHNISGTAKAAVQSLMAFYIWGNEATVNGILGIFLVIFGSGLYTWVQMNTPAPAENKK